VSWNGKHDRTIVHRTARVCWAREGHRLTVCFVGRRADLPAQQKGCFAAGRPRRTMVYRTECVLRRAVSWGDGLRARKTQTDRLKPVTQGGMNMFVKSVARLGTFSAERMTKSSVAEGEFLFAGLNCFEPGQEHALHSHAGQDKLYVLLEGAGIVQVGEKSELLSAGDAAFAPSGVVHAIRNPGPGRLVVMAILSPPPSITVG
jgi:quercetin dioxygenase-like cupin family protein